MDDARLETPVSSLLCLPKDKRKVYPSVTFRSFVLVKWRHDPSTGMEADGLGRVSTVEALTNRNANRGVVLPVAWTSVW